MALVDAGVVYIVEQLRCNYCVAKLFKEPTILDPAEFGIQSALQRQFSIRHGMKKKLYAPNRYRASGQ